MYQNVSYLVTSHARHARREAWDHAHHLTEWPELHDVLKLLVHVTQREDTLGHLLYHPLLVLTITDLGFGQILVILGELLKQKLKNPHFYMLGPKLKAFPLPKTFHVGT